MEELGVGWEMVDVPSDILLALQTGVRRERENIGTREGERVGAPSIKVFVTRTHSSPRN